MELMEYVALKIRELREQFNGGQGISQTMLAKQLNVTANTISRWETGEYKPKIEDLDKIAHFFGVSVLVFFKEENVNSNERVNALLRAASGLDDDDLDELKKFAEFRTAQKLYQSGKRPKAGRKKSK